MAYFLSLGILLCFCFYEKIPASFMLDHPIIVGLIRSTPLIRQDGVGNVLTDSEDRC